MAPRSIATPLKDLGRRQVSPDDVLQRFLERDQRLADDARTAAQVWLGEPEYARSALALHRQQHAAKPAGLGFRRSSQRPWIRKIT